ncbi:Vegetative incompatibility protein HET-E-1 [Colletotrichum viniferum]|nr:Vegetative incompatibility protein HET-E-1 [Colletotrichum viniferum]
MAYCLLGIFDVHIPLIYGEGRKAFRRLQLEIIKGNNDLTILAWKEPESLPAETQASPYMGLLAQSPQDFSMSGSIKPFRTDYAEFSATNRGLVISPDVPLRIFPGLYKEVQQPVMLLGWDWITRIHGGIPLKKVGPGLFYRKKHEPWVGFDSYRKQIRVTKNETSFCIMIDPDRRSINHVQGFRKHAIYVSHESGLRVRSVAPERLWDSEDQVFLRPKPYNDVYFPIVLGILFETASRALP